MDMLVVIGVLASILSLVTAAWAIMRFFIRPKLHIQFLAEETFHVRKHSKDQRSIWLHVMVRNESRYRTAGNSRGYLQRVVRVDEVGTEHPVKEYNQKLPLQWAHLASKTSFDIEPKDRARLDVIYIVEDDPRLHVATSSAKPTGTVKAVGVGTYILDIVCYADNARKGFIRLRISFDGRFEWPIVETWHKRKGWVEVKADKEFPDPMKLGNLQPSTTATIIDNTDEYLCSPIPPDDIETVENDHRRTDNRNSSKRDRNALGTEDNIQADENERK